jgi:DNA (cytosine-5)-methyltransferase 1
VIDCAEATRPRAVIVENVPDFARWTLYPLWREALVRLGFHVQEHIADATAFGVPQRRNRLVIVATRKPIAIELPRVKVEPAFGPCIEFDQGRWRSTALAAPNARARFAHGRRNWGRTFLSQHVTAHPGVPLTQAIRTITTKDQWVIVDGNRYRPLTIREYARAMSFRDSYAWPDDVSRADNIRGIGNAIPPLVGKGMVSLVAEAVS